MSQPNVYARVKPLNPRQGYILNRYHFLGNLFVGGVRPTWYRVSEKFANYCREDRQETGVPAFDVVTEAEKQEIDAKEEQLRLVQLGLLSATVQGPQARQPIDIREAPTPKPAPRAGDGRLDAIPAKGEKDPNGVLTTPDFDIGAK